MAREKAIGVFFGVNDSDAMPRPRKQHTPTASEQLEALLGAPWPFTGRSPRHDLSSWVVHDDWPNSVPVTLAEVEIFEHFFGGLIDELFKAAD